MKFAHALSLLAVLVLCSACDKTPETAPDKTVPSPAKPASSIQAALPVEQAAFMRGVALTEAAGPNDQGFCAEFQKTASFDNWIGTIEDFRTSTVNGSIDITFDMGGVLFEQVVQKTDPLYASVEPLLVGARVQLSGQFSHGNGECGYSLRTISIGLTKVHPI